MMMRQFEIRYREMNKWCDDGYDTLRPVHQVLYSELWRPEAKGLKLGFAEKCDPMGQTLGNSCAEVTPGQSGQSGQSGHAIV
jgi:hypothetical protein